MNELSSSLIEYVLTLLIDGWIETDDVEKIWKEYRQPRQLGPEIFPEADPGIQSIRNDDI